MIVLRLAMESNMFDNFKQPMDNILSTVNQ